MTINLLKHKEDLLRAYNDVLQSEMDGEWATFSYEGTSNTLKSEASGHDGINEVKENLSNGKLMYALMKIKDPSTGLWKLMLIHWQGDCVPSIKLGPFASHIHEVKKFFKGVHLTHYARCEDDVDMDSIMKSFKKVNYGAGSVIQRDVSKEPMASPSVYEKVDLKKDLNAQQRDEFWTAAEREEAKRQEEDKKRVVAERRRLEEEQHKIQQYIYKQSAEAEPRQNIIGSEMMRRERLQEVNEVISPKANLKSMWEEKTALKEDGPIIRKNPVAVKKAPVPVPVPVLSSKSAQPELPHENGNKKDSLNQPKIDEFTNSELKGNLRHLDRANSGEIGPEVDGGAHTLGAATTNLKVTPHVAEADCHSDDVDKDWEAVSLEKEPEVETYDDLSFEPPSDESVKPAPTAGCGLQAEALWDYQAADETEISFNPGDVIIHIDCIDEGWWRGQGPDGSVGLFPANYVEVLQP